MFHRIPWELQQLDQWVIWRYETDDKGKPTKVPYSPLLNKRASHNDPKTWCSFSIACKSAIQWNCGIGFVFSDHDPYCGIDFDSKDQTSKEEFDKQLEFYNKFDSYSEVSPSGKGLHIIVKAKLDKGWHPGSIGVFSNNRYFAFTGNIYNDKPIKEAQRIVDELISTFKKPLANSSSEFISIASEVSDDEILRRAFEAKDGIKFAACYNAQWQGIYSSQSESDQSLFNILAFWTKDDSQIKRIFAKSPAGNTLKNGHKRCSNLNYVNKTLHKARDNELPPIEIIWDGSSPSAALTNGPVAQRLELTAHNGLVAGSNPAGTTNRPEPLPRPIPGMPFVPITDDFGPPPGFVGELAGFYYSSAPYPHPDVATIGALSLMAAICGRAYSVSSTGLNLYSILVAETGVGKEVLSSATNKLLDSVVADGVHSAREFIYSQIFASGQAMPRLIAKQPCGLAIMDEFGLLMQRLTARNAPSSMTAMKEFILKLFHKSGPHDRLPTFGYSDKEKDLPEVLGPALTILGETAPTHLYNNMDDSLVSDGFLARFLLIEARKIKDDKYNDNAGEYAVPFRIQDRLSKIVVNSLHTQKTKIRIPVLFTPEANDFLSTYRVRTRSATKTTQHEGVKHLWNRAHIKALRVAGLLAIGEDMLKPVVTIEQAKWAVQIVDLGIKTIIRRFTSGHVGEGDHRQQAELGAFLYRYAHCEGSELPRAGYREELHAQLIVPYGYLLSNLCGRACFRDRTGASNALRRTIRDFVSAGLLQEIELTVQGKRLRSQNYQILDAAALAGYVIDE